MPLCNSAHLPRNNCSLWYLVFNGRAAIHE
jgi:hypothetical protein